MSLQCRTHGGDDTEPFIFDLEAFVTSHTETCFSTDSHTHLPLRIILLPPLEFSLYHSEGEEDVSFHKHVESDRLFVESGSTAQHLLPSPAVNENIPNAETDFSRTNL